MKIKVDFEKPFFDDIEPEPKSSDELAICLLRDASGIKSSIKKYNEREINHCARQLIESGLLRGTVTSFKSCIWSRPTRKGQMYLRLFDSDPENFNPLKIL
jgi:hypothetical protein